MEILEFIGQTLLGELIVVVVGVLFAHSLRNWYQDWRYGHWQVIVRRGGANLVERDVSPRKVQEVLEEPADLVTFLKGVISPYAWVKCDLITEGQRLELLVVDRDTRRFIVDLDRNPGET